MLVISYSAEDAVDRRLVAILIHAEMINWLAQ